MTIYTVSGTERPMLQSFWESSDRLAKPLYIDAEFYWRDGPGYLPGTFDEGQTMTLGTAIDYTLSVSQLLDCSLQ